MVLPCLHKAGRSLDSVSSLPALIAAEQNECSVYLLVKGDYGNIMASSLSSLLSKKGIKISKAEKSANYTATALVESNPQGENPVAVYPSLDFKIVNKDGESVYSADIAVEKKTIAYTLENAQKKAYPILADESSKVIDREFSQKFGY